MALRYDSMHGFAAFSSGTCTCTGRSEIKRSTRAWFFDEALLWSLLIVSYINLFILYKNDQVTTVQL